jgi:hypothetical protein
MIRVLSSGGEPGGDERISGHGVPDGPSRQGDRQDPENDA